jgi:hypothetical protein
MVAGWLAAGQPASHGAMAPWPAGRLAGWPAGQAGCTGNFTGTGTCRGVVPGRPASGLS